MQNFYLLSSILIQKHTWIEIITDHDENEEVEEIEDEFILIDDTETEGIYKIVGKATAWYNYNWSFKQQNNIVK